MARLPPKATGKTRSLVLSLPSGGIKQSLASFAFQACLCVHHHMPSSVCVCFSLSGSPSAFLCKDPSHWLRAPQIQQDLTLTYSCKDPISK